MCVKQCGNCKYSRTKPPIGAACNNKVKSIEEAGKMLYNGANMPYCEFFKPCYKGGK